MTLKVVCHIPELQFNLMSSTVLDRKGYSHQLGDEVEFIGDNKYFVTFIDDAFRKTLIYLLRSKDKETLEEEKQTQAMDGVRDITPIPIPEEDAIDGIDPHEAELMDDEEPATSMDGTVEPDNEGVEQGELTPVDDMLIVGQDMAMICKPKEELSKSFDMKDLGPARQNLIGKLGSYGYHKKSMSNGCLRVST
ncbi:hypothetical protein CRG98_034888 [Punica granatum]|uniref:Uncharacterized protein n=1 Tax=Punica granatum TaxID=22663 RepID=A0A2I0IL45_PUNGR|nr:hypothetical protein CRG98_034888 [Punica granatum]